jgi:hypothetical protein
MVDNSNSDIAGLQEAVTRTITEYLSKINHAPLKGENIKLMAQLSVTPFGRELLQIADMVALLRLLNFGTTDVNYDMRGFTKTEIKEIIAEYLAENSIISVSPPPSPAPTASPVPTASPAPTPNPVPAASPAPVLTQSGSVNSNLFWFI